MLSFGRSFFASEVKHYAKYVLDIVYLVIKMRSFRKFYDITMPGRWIKITYGNFALLTTQDYVINSKLSSIIKIITQYKPKFVYRTVHSYRHSEQ